MKEAGSALMGIGRGSGENRAADAARQAIASPLLEINIAGAQGVLFNITGGADLGLYEVNEAAQIIKETADPEANIIFGTVIDEHMGDDLQITVIATGFDAKRTTQRHTQSAPAEVSVRSAGGRDFLRELETQRAANTGTPAPAARQPAAAAPQAPAAEGNGQPRPYPEQGTAGVPPQAQPGQPAAGQAPGAPASSTNVRAPELEDLDIPAFLRRGK